MSGSGEAVGGGGALAAATGTAEGGSELKGGGQTNLYPTEHIVSAAAPPDYTTMTGGRFQFDVGVDPEKWAAAFLQAYAQSDSVRTEADRQSFVASWFRDAMDAARKTHINRVMGHVGQP